MSTLRSAESEILYDKYYENLKFNQDVKSLVYQEYMSYIMNHYFIAKKVFTPVLNSSHHYNNNYRGCKMGQRIEFSMSEMPLNDFDLYKQVSHHKIITIDKLMSNTRTVYRFISHFVDNSVVLVDSSKINDSQYVLGKFRDVYDNMVYMLF